MDGIVNQSLLFMFGKGIPMKFRVMVRVVNALIVIVLYEKGGVDWVIVYSLIVVMSDLDSIAEKLEKKYKKDND